MRLLHLAPSSSSLTCRRPEIQPAGLRIPAFAERSGAAHPAGGEPGTRWRLRPWSSLIILAIVVVAVLTGAHRASADTFSTPPNVTVIVGEVFTVTWTVTDTGTVPNFCTAGTTVSVTFGATGPINSVGATDTTTNCSASNQTVAIQLTGTQPGMATVNVGIGSNKSSSVQITIRPAQNTAPVVAPNPVSASTNEDTAVAITIPATDADNDTLTYTVFSGPSHGTLSGTGATRTYTPTANYNGSDSYAVTVTDGYGGSVTATVNITVTPVNDAPVAVPDTYTATEDTALDIGPAQGVLANDTDADGDRLIVYSYSDPAYGTLTIRQNGSFVYRPAANFSGTDSFTYVVDGGAARSGGATVTITVTPVNDAPSASPQSVTTAEDTATTITLAGTDVDGDPLTYLIATGPMHGTLSSVTGNQVTYTPVADFNGTDSFTFTVSDGTTTSAPATVTIIVTAVNDAPFASPQSVETAEDMATTITLAGTDAESDPLTYAIATGPAHGSLSSIAGNQVTYTPSANYNGPDSFTYTISDGTSMSAAATISISVSSVNDAPIIDDTTIPQDQTVEATSPDGATVTFALPSATDPDGTTPTVTCDPASGSPFPIGETTTVTCTATDGELSDTATFTVRVTDAAKPVLGLPVTITVEARSSAGAIVNYTATASDAVDGPITPVCTPASGSLFPQGTTTVTCTATDAAGNVATGSFTVTVGDTTGPVITWVGGPQPGKTYTQATLPAEPTCTATDTSSPVVQCRVYGYSTAPGTHTLTARARDSEGNAIVATRTYTVTASAPTATPRPATPTPRLATATPPSATETPVPPQPTAVPTRAPRPTATPVTPSVPTAAPTRAPRA